MISVTHDHLDSLAFTVHDFTYPGSHPQRSQDAILDRGRRVLKDALLSTSDHGWTGRAFILREQSFEIKIDNLFILREQPPEIPWKEPLLSKDWGGSVTEDEMFLLHQLEEFSPSSTFVQDVASDAESSTRTKRERNPSPTRDSDPKRRKLNTRSLYRIIPQPHIHPSPFLASPPPLIGRSYTKTTPVFLAPYTSFSVHDDARVAWLVPVRGLFPWDECTSALLLDPALNTPSLIEGNRIHWTTDALLKFWEFLLDLRGSSSLGALGVSFHHAKPKKTTHLPMKADARVNPASRPPAPSASTSSGSALANARLRLSAMDYIKIYHDASRAFYVRTALDVWAYQPVNPAGDGENGKPLKYRMLKGAKLPLVDEISSGILVS